MVAADVNFQNGSKLSPEVISGGLIFLALLALAFWIHPLYAEYTEKAAQKTEIDNQLEGLKSENDRLQKALTESKKPEGRADIERYGLGFREDALLEALISPRAQMAFGDVSFSEGEKMENGFNLGKTSLALQAANLDVLLKYLDDLTAPTAKRRFIIDSLTFPLDTRDFKKAFWASLSVGAYYFAF